MACKSLDLLGGTIYSNSYQVNEIGKIWLSSVNCKGSEKYIQDCRHDSWGVNACNHNNDIYISCYHK